MTRRVAIVGAGFAGMYAAIAAARLRSIAKAAPDELEVLVVAPDASLTLRPRLYEDDPANMSRDLSPLFTASQVLFQRGHVTRVDAHLRTLQLSDAEGASLTVPYDAAVLAAGSRVIRPDIPGLAEHAFSVDDIVEADALWRHMHGLASRPALPGRNTVIIVGGGFTGIEVAAEMPRRLRAILGDGAASRVVVVEQAGEIGPDLGPGPRPVIERAMRELGIECLLGRRVAAINAEGVTLDNGDHLVGATVVWTGGLRATSLTADVPGIRDDAGRLLVDRHLAAPGCDGLFIAGDAAKAATDDDGNFSLMSCQHAMTLGRVAGHNAAADLLGLPRVDYRQERYVTCLDLGDWGAVLTSGWERTVVGAGPAIKQLKREINAVAIHPPPPNREQAFAAAAPHLSSVA